MLYSNSVKRTKKGSGIHFICVKLISRTFIINISRMYVQCCTLFFNLGEIIQSILELIKGNYKNFDTLKLETTEKIDLKTFKK